MNVACPLCDGVLALYLTHVQSVEVTEEVDGWSIRAVPGQHDIEIQCSTCGAEVASSDSTPGALSVVLGKIKQGQLSTKETSNAG